MLYRLLIVMMLSVLLVACGSDEGEVNDTEDDIVVEVEDSADNSEDDESEQETTVDSDAPEFLLTVSGAETFELDTSVTFSCREDQFALVTSSFAPAISLYLPSNIDVGTYPLADYNASADPIQVEGSGVVVISGETSAEQTTANTYFMATDGEIVIEAVPEEAGQPFVATVTGTLTASDEESIDFTATYNLDTEALYYMDCEF